MGWVAHIRVESDAAPHPSFNAAIKSKLDGRQPVIWVDDDSIEVQFAVDDNSTESKARVGNFALSMCIILGVSKENITRLELSREKKLGLATGSRALRLVTDESTD